MCLKVVGFGDFDIGRFVSVLANRLEKCFYYTSLKISQVIILALLKR